MRVLEKAFFKNVNICNKNMEQKMSNVNQKVQSKPCKTSRMESFSKVVNGKSSTYSA